jgi:hypothetical protein
LNAANTPFVILTIRFPSTHWGRGVCAREREKKEHVNNSCAAHDEFVCWGCKTSYLVIAPQQSGFDEEVRVVVLAREQHYCGEGFEDALVHRFRWWLPRYPNLEPFE